MRKVDSRKTPDRSIDQKVMSKFKPELERGRLEEINMEKLWLAYWRGEIIDLFDRSIDVYCSLLPWKEDR